MNCDLISDPWSERYLSITADYYANDLHSGNPPYLVDDCISLRPLIEPFEYAPTHQKAENGSFHWSWIM
jgi:hypothetical protein